LRLRDTRRMNHAVTRARLHQGAAGPSDDLAYWLNQSVQARLDGVEVLRQDSLRMLPDAEQRLQRVCRITRLKRG
jgi:hypothetical protein